MCWAVGLNDEPMIQKVNEDAMGTRINKNRGVLSFHANDVSCYLVRISSRGDRMNPTTTWLTTMVAKLGPTRSRCTSGIVSSYRSKVSFNVASSVGWANKCSIS